MVIIGKRYLSMISLAVCFFVLSSQIVESAPLKVFLLAGQSNAVGAGVTSELPAYLNCEHPTIKYYANVKFYPVSEPLATPWSNLRPGFGLESIDFGSEITMGRVLFQYIDNNIAIVKYAVGATSLAVDWKPPVNGQAAGPLYNSFITTVKSAMASAPNGYEPEIAGMFWMQGESDALNLSYAQNYQTNLTSFISSVRSDFNVPAMPVVIGQISEAGMWTYGQTVRNAQQAVIGSVAHTAMVPTADLTFDGGGIHYGTDGQIQLGIRFAEAMKSLLPVQNKNFDAGDLDKNGVVNFNDLKLFAGHWLSSCYPLEWCLGSDFDHSATVTIKDYAALAGRYSEGTTVEIHGNDLVIGHDGLRYSTSLNCPRFVFNSGTVGGDTVSPISISGTVQAGELVEVAYQPIAIGYSTLTVKLNLQWSASEKIVRKWASYRLSGESNNLVLKEVVFDQFDKNRLIQEMLVALPQSYPVFIKGFFLGVEFPVASTRIEGQNVIVAHRPGLRIQSNIPYETRRIIYGAAPDGKERDSFLAYVESHRPEPRSFHINYNSWWTSPVPFTEPNILELIQKFKDHLYTPYGVAFDTFTIDLGWTKPQSIWEIDPALFPQGFSNLQNALAAMNSNLGVWSSPTCFYGQAVDTEWAMQQGYETFLLKWAGPGLTRLCCMAGSRYHNAYKTRLVDMVNSYGVKHYKFDGYWLYCSESGHGHEPNDLSSEAVAQNGIDIFDSLRNRCPDIWLETTCFGWNPSPWWLFHVNSVLSPFGDDAPRGKIPCPVYRESYTTARDSFNLQGASLLPIPITAQEVLGVIHQSPEPFLNDAVTTVLRGHSFLPLYMNPAYMNDDRWRALAQLLGWTRTNSGILEHTVPLLPQSWLNNKQPKFIDVPDMPREVYGYAHCKDDRGIIMLRNPWIKPEVYSLTLDEGIGLAAGFPAKVSVVSLYPEVRVYGENCSYGDVINVPVAPYETAVLSIRTDANTIGIGRVDASIGNKIKVTGASSVSDSNLGINLQATLDSNAPQTKLFVLMEGIRGAVALDDPLSYQLSINDSTVSMQKISSENGWCAAGAVEYERWLFLQADLASHNVISLQVQPGKKCTNISVWAWATKAGNSTPAFSNAFPSPEMISLDAVQLCAYSREQAWSPIPNNGQKILDANTSLSWNSGYKALSHDVYFGMSVTEVQNATRTSPEFRGNQPANDLDWMATNLTLSNTYYWRIDEVYDNNTVKGLVWSFSVSTTPSVGWWKFDETSGTVAVDSSGNGFNGTIIGAQRQSGKIDGALSFGDNSRVEIPSQAFSSVSGQITIAFWQFGYPNFYNSIFQASSGGFWPLNCHLPWSVDSTVYWDAGNPRDRISRLANTTEYQGRWNHWVFTKNARTNSMAMYLNGVLWHSGAGASSISGITAFIIGSGVGGAYQYKGLIDDFRIYNCSLSAAQVDVLYKSF